jgi:hypothetical protein
MAEPDPQRVFCFGESDLLFAQKLIRQRGSAKIQKLLDAAGVAKKARLAVEIHGICLHAVALY